VGALATLWCLADQHATPDGMLFGYLPEDIDRMIGLPGFCKSLPADWIDLTGEWVKLPEYQAHNGTTAKSRAVDQKRKAASRSVSKFCPSSVQVLSVSQPDKKTPRGEKIRVDKNTNNPLPPKGEETLADDKETELQPNISTSNEVPIINNPRQATRDKGGKFSEEQLSEMQAQFSEFRDYAKKIGMTAKSLEKEFANFIKKHHKKAQEILPILIPCLEAYYQDKTKCGTKPIDKQYIPHMQTYINGSHWEHYAEKITKQEPYEKIPNVFTIPRAIVSEIFRSKVNAEEWDETFALAQWNLYMKKSETLKNQAHDKQ